MPFRIGLSGLNAAQADLKITGNNIANVSTIGFKQSRAEFADVYATSKFGSVSTAIGSGVRLAAASQQFTQGNIIFTENNLDLGITGDGFFTMADVSGNQVYTRNGQFKTDKEGFIVDNSGSSLRGYGVDAVTNNINTGSVIDLQIISTNIAPEPTATASIIANIDSGEALPSNPIFSMDAKGTVDPGSYNHTTSFTSFDSLGNPMLTSMFYRKTASNTWDVAIKQVDANGNIFQNFDSSYASFSAPKPGDPEIIFVPTSTQGSNEVAAAITDAAALAPGTPATAEQAVIISNAYINAYDTAYHAGMLTTPTMASPFAAANTAGITAADAAAVVLGLDAGTIAAITGASGAAQAAAVTPESITFLNNGTIDLTSVGSGSGSFNTIFNLANTNLTNPVMSDTGGALQAQIIAIDLSGVTQYGANFGVTNLSQNGFTTGQLSGIDVDQSGVISARFTNGQSNRLGQVFITNFTNNQGLSQLGDNYWGESFASGQGIVNAPGEGNAGLINSGSLEDSNVDLTEQLINLITAQRNFQANAKTITTADTITQTVIQI